MYAQTLSRAAELLEERGRLDLQEAQSLFCTVLLAMHATCAEKRQALDGICAVLTAQDREDEIASFRQMANQLILQVSICSERGAVPQGMMAVDLAVLQPVIREDEVAMLYQRAYEESMRSSGAERGALPQNMMFVNLATLRMPALPDAVISQGK